MLSGPMSRGTIERWALERRVRPEASGLQWLGYIKPEIQELRCPWCDEIQPHQGVVRVEDRTLYMCPSCGSHQYRPQLEQQLADEMTPFAVRNYVEYGAGLQPFCEYIATLTAGREGGALLDVGCGFGFAVDIARRQKGWRAVGADPSPLARAGTEALGVTIHPVALGTERLGESQFQAILCAEVLAHAVDPAEVIRGMARHLAPDGAILIATASPDALYETENIGIIREVLSPKQHATIPTALGLTRLIERLGLSVLHSQRSGISLRALIAPTRSSLASEGFGSGNRVADAYFSSILSEGISDPCVWIGIATRAFDHAVSIGDWTRAGILERRMGRWIHAAEMAALEHAGKRNIAELFADAPVCSCILLYDVAMLALNQQNYEKAQRFFGLSAELSLRAFELAPDLMAPEAERHFAARVHEAIASSHESATRESRLSARSILDSVVRGSASLPTPEAWRLRAQQELRTLNLPEKTTV